MSYHIIGSVTVGSGGNSYIEFSSIPSTYVDLALYVSARTDTTSGGDGDYAVLNAFNGVGTGRTQRFLYADRSGNVYGGYTTNNVGLAWANSTTHSTESFSNNFYYIFNYASTSTAKVVMVDSASASLSNPYHAGQSIANGKWDSNSAITSLQIWTSSGAKFVQNSTATLYGIAHT